MNVFKLATRNLLFRKSSHLLSLLLLICGLTLVLLVREYNRQAEEKLAKNLSTIDLVVGAKGSPLQLILSAIYQVDAPTGNIPLKSARNLSRNPMVDQVIPMAYGDNYLGYRILGTNLDYPNLYDAQLEKGNWWNKDLEVVVGAAAAKKLNLDLGQEFHGQHGLSEESESDHGHYRVVGTLQETGTVIDQLILCSVGTVWEVHHPQQKLDHQNDDLEITALLITYKNPMAAIQLPRMINQQPHLQAAAPAIEINRVYHLLNLGSSGLAYFGFGLLALAFLSFFVQTAIQLNSRQAEFALLRSLGAATHQLIGLLLLESLVVAILAWTGAELSARTILYFFADPLGYGQAYAGEAFHFSMTDLWILLASIACATLAILLHIRKVYRAEIPDLLKED